MAEVALLWLPHTGNVIKGLEEPQATGEDGRVAQQLMVAGYQSAGSRRAVELPFRPSGVAKPIDLWFHPIED